MRAPTLAGCQKKLATVRLAASQGGSLIHRERRRSSAFRTTKFKSKIKALDIDKLSFSSTLGLATPRPTVRQMLIHRHHR
jgi:hypothetical protein